MTPRTLLPPAEWYASLPTLLGSASVIITDPARTAVLAVKPNYRPWWNIPGGILEAAEPPHLCCAREVGEELGIELSIGRLLVVDWVPPTDARQAFMGFVFDGGVLADTSGISLQSEELDAWAFVPRGELRERLTTNTADRVEAALRVRDTGAVAYLHGGAPVT